jgi:hypothetical protein
MPRSLSPYPSRQESCKPQQSRLSQKNSAEHPGRLIAVAPTQEMNCSLIEQPKQPVIVDSNDRRRLPKHPKP